jgi:predicted DNA-binding antitoxin AbrB/MazE fold protein
MSITFDAIYEDGVLKPVSPLPLKEHEQVRATLVPKTSEEVGWRPLIDCDDPALIEQAALDPELDF